MIHNRVLKNIRFPILAMSIATFSLMPQVHAYQASIVSSSSQSTFGVGGVSRISSQRSIFGSPFANQPFSISGMVGSQNAFGGIGAPGLVGPGPIVGRGCFNPWPLGGLGIVSPGWGWGPVGGFWGAPFGAVSTGWWGGGWNQPFVVNSFWNNVWGWGPVGWNSPVPLWGVTPMPLWGNWGNEFVWDWGFLGAMNDVVQQGNARFGAARPVRAQRAAGRNGVIVPPGLDKAGAAMGFNAVPPFRPHFRERQDQVFFPARIVRPNRIPNKVPSVTSKVERPVKLAAKSDEARLKEKLQNADRLARNGLLDEALERYRAAAASMPDEPGPWFRMAQIYLISERPSDAIEAISQAERRETPTDRSYTKQLKWSDIADAPSMSRMASRFEEWSADPNFAGLDRLKATLTETVRPIAMR